MTIPLDSCMFSAPGSYLALGLLDRGRYPEETASLGEGVYLRQLYGAGRRSCLKFTLRREEGEIAALPSATPGAFTLAGESGRLRMTFDGVHRLQAESAGCSVRLQMAPVMYEYAARLDSRRFLFNSSASRIQFLITVWEGEGVLTAPYGEAGCTSMTLDVLADDASGRALFTLEDFEAVAPACEAGRPDFDACASRLAAAFDRFAAPFPSLPEPFQAAREEALYTLFSCIVEPRGHLTRRAVLMSKNWMPNVWTWDSVINSMALLLGDPILAKEQFFASLDHQTPEGLLPDYINPAEVMWNFTKPPIHGIAALHGMMDAFTPAELAEAYEKMQRQTDYWLAYMDSDHDGIPQYNHGNDCGWDNCTPFRVGPPVEGPDLCAYIILQLYALEQMAVRLGRSERDWRAEASELLRRLLSHSYDGKAFHVYQSGTHREFTGGDSLYPFMPLVLGRYLPPEIFAHLTQELKEPGRFLTPVGLASESLKSPFYEEDSYWRGPVWPSVMMLLIQGIADGGDTAFSRDLAARFCRCILKNGFAENFQATTGKGLRDPAHTWTAAAFLVLACRYL
ncbi:MAG TPA: hypothetical protein IAC49_06490 [Candidatus Ventricola intestinavium]|nr:hypothetical protein [Candidatus Ventricola intestinavium]